jgi:hypothetical protein
LHQINQIKSNQSINQSIIQSINQSLAPRYMLFQGKSLQFALPY